MTLEEKILQMFVITPEALTGYGSVTAAGNATKAALKNRPVGGLIYFSGNIVDETQITSMISNTQSYALKYENYPLFMCIDEEGGKVARIAKNSNFDVSIFDDMKTIGDSGDTKKAYEVGSTIGQYLSKYGFNVDFAPDADVLTNSVNTVIGTRSFGSDARLVTKMTLAVKRGLEENNVYATFKHFPGHGATTGDTHEGFAYIDKTYKELLKSELLPFKNAIKDNANFIMVAHISAPQIIGDNTPSSLSKTMITDILRDDFGYDGVVITDALNMGAIADHYSAATAAVKAVNAGVDILLMPSDFEAAYQGILKAVSKGLISEERIDESVGRILKLKIEMKKAYGK
jgi:beta-N-acetylhexosaminidase